LELKIIHAAGVKLPRRGQSDGRKKKGAQTLRCCAPRLVPSPRYFAKLTNRLQRGAG
jgi:hypothetical protein